MNTAIIEEFRANSGKCGGPFEGAPMILVHHVGRKSGKESVAPLMYLPSDDDPNALYIFASKGGAPTNPAYYYNLVASGRATVEVGTETFDVTVTELTGEDRVRVYAEQASRYPGFADYAKKTEGIRVIPVLKLARV